MVLLLQLLNSLRQLCHPWVLRCLAHQRIRAASERLERPCQLRELILLRQLILGRSRCVEGSQQILSPRVRSEEEVLSPTGRREGTAG